MTHQEKIPTLSTAVTQSTPSSTAQLMIQSSLMKGYRQATPAHAGTQLATARGADGLLQVFTIGSQGEVNNIYRDTKSDTGWSVVNLNLPVKVTTLATGNDPDGTIVVVASGVDNHLYAIRDTRWNSAWHDWGFWGQPRLLSYPITHLKLGRYLPQGPLNCLVFAAKGHHWYCSVVDAVTGAIIQTYIGSTEFEYPGDATLAMLKQGGNVQQGTLFGETFVKNGFGMIFLPQHQSLPNSGYSSDPYIKVSTLLKADGTPQYFALRADNNHLIRVTLVDLNHASFQDIGEDNKYIRLSTTTDDNDLTEIFAITDQNRLFYIHEDPLLPAGWAAPAPLSDQIIQVVAAKNSDGSSEAFAIDGKNRLLHIVQDSDTSTWHIEPIEFGTQPVLEELNTYTTQISLRDTQGQPLAYVPVQIASPALLSLQVNGVTHQVDAVTSATTLSNAHGEVNVIVASTTLSTPELWISAEALGNSYVVYQANAFVAQYFRQQTPQTLLAAVVEDGKGNSRPFIVGDDTTRKAIANSMAPFLQESFSHFSVAQLSSVSPHFFAESTGAVVVPMSGPTFQQLPLLDAVGKLSGLEQTDRHWQLTLSGSASTFTMLSPQEATRLFEEAKSPVPQGSGGDGWHLLETIGELYDLVTSFGSRVNVLTNLANFVVSESPQGLNVLIDLVLDNARYRLRALLTKGQEIIDMVGAALSWLENQFEDLLNLLKGAIYWDDIMRTREAISGVFSIACDSAASLLNTIKQQIHVEVSGWEEKITQFFTTDTLQQLFGTATVNTSYLSQALPKMQAPLFTTVRYQLVQQLLMTHLAESSTPKNSNEAAMREVLAFQESLADDFITEVAAILQSLRDSRAFASLQSKLAAYLTPGADLRQAPVDLLLEVLKDIALFCLEAAETLLGKLIDKAAEIIKSLPQQGLVQLLSIPVLSDLYLSHGGKDLAIFDIAAFALSFPITLYYRDTFGKSLFADDASVQTFKTWFTAQIQGIHLRQTPVEQLTGYVEPAKQWSGIAGIGGALLQTLQGLLDAQLDIQSVMVDANGAKKTYGAGGRVGPSRSFGKDLVLPDTAITGLSGFSLLLQALEQVVAIDFTWTPTVNGSLSQISFINWWISWLPTLADVISQLVNARATRLVDDGPAILDTVVGTISLISSCVQVGFQFHDEKKHDSFLESALVIGKLSGAAKFLRVKKIVEGTEGVSLAILAALDILSNSYIAVADLYVFNQENP